MTKSQECLDKETAKAKQAAQVAKMAEHEKASKHSRLSMAMHQTRTSQQA